MEHNKNQYQMLNIINRTRQFSNSKDKNKNAMALYTISTELNKIKNISKRKKPTNNLFNNIPVPESLTMKPLKLKKNNRNSYLNNLNPTQVNHHRNRSASHSPNQHKEILNTCPNSNSNLKATHISTKMTNNFNLIPKTSFERNKLKNEIDSLKNELKKRDELLLIKNEKIETLQKNLDISQHNLSCIKGRYLKVKEQLNTTINEIKNLKILNEQAQSEIKFLNEKEIKLMQVIFLIKEKGINIDEILNDVSQMNNQMSSSSRTDISKASTVYFPDKVKMEESKDQNLVPKLDFGSVPTYKSETESGDNNDNENNNEEIEVATFNDNKEGVFQTKIDTEDMKFNKIDFTHEDSNFHKENQILSDQNECNSLKIASQKYV